MANPRYTLLNASIRGGLDISFCTRFGGEILNRFITVTLRVCVSGFPRTNIFCGL
jgi:hypothetical protein